MMSSSSRATVARRALSRNGAIRKKTTVARSSRVPRSLAAAVRSRQNLFLPAAQYSTETALKLRGSEIDTKNQKILYDAQNEQDSCGVGLIGNLKSKPSRHVVEVADEMLVRMSHRGGCGCDPNSGDGAGKCTEIISSHGLVCPGFQF